jgi:hypothetical protein
MEHIPNADKISAKTVFVCERHFHPDDVIFRHEEQNNVDNEGGPRKRLKPGAFPRFFNVGQNQFPPTGEKYQSAFEFETFLQFLLVFDKIVLPSGWHKIKSEDKCTIFKIEEIPGPVTTHAFTIGRELKTHSYFCGKEIEHNFHGISTPFTIIRRVSDIFQIINWLDINDSDSSRHNHCISNMLDHVSNILCKTSEDSEDKGLKFITEQLRLKACSKERYRYSVTTMILASIMHSISPHAYKFLRNSGQLILPHPKTIKCICNKLLTDPTLEERNSFCSYAKTIYKYLKEDEKTMILLMDEIHVQPYLDYKGGNIVGKASNSNSLANTAYVFMISSVKSAFKEVVHISPSCNIDHKTLFNF